jgi:flavin reductase (DIM6/NTAB) family NADH-FMN oxidoreductase RutF
MQKVIAKGVSLGMYIITANSGGKANGMTACWATQVSFSPLLMMVSIGPNKYTNELIKQSGYFAINVLSSGQTKEAKHFGFQSGRAVDKLKDFAYSNAPQGSPILDIAMAYCECKLKDIFPAGDHELFVGEVVNAKLIKEVDPLLFVWDEYF